MPRDTTYHLNLKQEATQKNNLKENCPQHLVNFINEFMLVDTQFRIFQYHGHLEKYLEYPRNLGHFYKTCLEWMDVWKHHCLEKPQRFKQFPVPNLLDWSCHINFFNLTQLNLSGNNITNVEALRFLNAPNIK